MRQQARAAESSPKISWREAEDRDRSIRQEFVFVEEATADALVSCSPAGAVVRWNRGAEHIYGYSAREAIGRPISFLAASGHIDQMARTVERARQGAPVVGYELIQKRKDGAPVHAVLNIAPVFDARGKVIRISVIGRDLTALRRARDSARSALEQYHQLLDDVPCGIFYMDTMGKLLYANAALARILCYGSVRDLLRVDARTRLFPDARAFADFIAQETALGERGGISMQWRRADQTPIRVRLTSRVITNDRKDLIAYEVFVEEIGS